MKIWNSFRIAFSMFSKIPMGRIDWKEDNMKYSMCFVPMIGLVIGAMQIGWWYLAFILGLNRAFCAIIAVIIPMIVTGGIHMDGFCDVVDAISSYGTKEKKLQILKDPHIGAFATMWSIVYMLGCVGAFMQIQTVEVLWVIGIGYVLSRAVSCLLAMLLKNAKAEGSLHSITSSQEKGISSALLMFWIFAAAVAIFMIDFLLGVLVVVATLIMVVYYQWMTRKNFGGITGDMAGFLIQMLEITILYVCVVGEILWKFM